LVGGLISGGLCRRRSTGADESAHKKTSPPKSRNGMKTPKINRAPMEQLYRNAFAVRESVYQEYPNGSVRNILSAPDGRPLQDPSMASSLGTDCFYERHHAGRPPQRSIPAQQHADCSWPSFDKPLIFANVMTSRAFPSQSQIYFLECSGNAGPTRSPMAKTALSAPRLVLWACAEMENRGSALETCFCMKPDCRPARKWVVREGADAAHIGLAAFDRKCL